MEWFLIFQSISEKSIITVKHINQEANRRKAEAKVKSSKPKKRTVETSICSDFDANIDEKDLVQSDPEFWVPNPHRYPTRKYPWNSDTNPIQPIPKFWFGFGYYPWVPEFWVSNPRSSVYPYLLIENIKNYLLLLGTKYSSRLNSEAIFTYLETQCEFDANP